MTARSTQVGSPGTGADQVVRLLGLMPYIARRPGISIGELAAEFAVSEEQITADLNLLMLCGEPGYYPHELIDMAFDEDGGSVAISYDAGLHRPVRLSTAEAVTLTVALRALAAMPGLVDDDAVHGALAKIGAVATGELPAVVVDAAPGSDLLPIVRQAIEGKRRLHLRYYSAWRDTVSERDVDPARLLIVDGHTYVEGYCYQAEDVRRFRLDRIESAEVLSIAVERGNWVVDEVPLTVFTPKPEASTVMLLLSPAARWIAEYYHMESIEDHDDQPGWLRARLQGGDDDWIVRLVLSLGGAARVVDRPDLRELIATRAEQALAHYDASR